MIHSSAASRIIRSIVALLLLTALTSILKMRSLNYILDKILELGIIALVVIFQPGAAPGAGALRRQKSALHLAG